MSSQRKHISSSFLRTIVLTLSALVWVLASCEAVQNEVPIPAPSLVLPPTSTSDTSTQPSPTVEGKPIPTRTPAGLGPEAFPVEALDFRKFFPPVPIGLGESANHLVFFSDRSGIYQLYQVSLDGSELVQLTDNPDLDAYDMEPAWYPDGRIAFTSTHVNERWEIFILFPDQRLPIQLTNLNADSWSLAWSPDGKQLAFVSNASQDDEIYLISTQGGDPVNLTNSPDSNDFLPTWTPDGEKIVFVSDRGEGLTQDIYIMEKDGSGQTPLIVSEKRDTSPDLSPDGEQIAFVSDREGNFEVYVTPIHGESKPIRLTNSPGYEWSPTWSPDGRWIAFTSLTNNGETYDVYTMMPDGSNITRLTFDPADDIIPRWWP